MSAYSDLILATPGLLSYYRLGEPSGTTASDATGNGRDLTYTSVTLGTTGLLTGDADTAATFNGSTSVAQVDNTTTMNFATGKAMSVEAWIKIAAPRNTYDFWLMLAVDSVVKYWFGTINTGLLYWNMGSSDQQGLSDPLVADTTYHVVFTGGIEGSTIVTRSYINGVEVESRDEGTSSLPNADYIAIGQTPGTGGLEFKGIIDEVAIYNVALTPAQVAAHYNGGLGVFASTGNSRIATQFQLRPY